LNSKYSAKFALAGHSDQSAPGFADAINRLAVKLSGRSITTGGEWVMEYDDHGAVNILTGIEAKLDELKREITNLKGKL
jgi:hypothetical protein